jgi:hypothetical protein
MPKVQLSVGGFVFDISAQVPLQIEEGYLPFLSEGQTPDFQIRCFAGAPEKFGKPDIQYQAQAPEGVLWEVNQGPEKTCILVYNPEDLTQLQQIAYWSEKERSWDIYVFLAEGDGINPLAYPLGPLIWYFLSTIEDVLMIHGSAVILDGQTRVFSGFSGVGKSTMAQLWADKRHATIINDDRLILRKEQDTWYVYNTPMFYAAAPQKGKLLTLFFPYHGPANKLELLSGVAA